MSHNLDICQSESIRQILTLFVRLDMLPEPKDIFSYFFLSMPAFAFVLYRYCFYSILLFESCGSPDSHDTMLGFSQVFSLYPLDIALVPSPGFFLYWSDNMLFAEKESFPCYSDNIAALVNGVSLCVRVSKREK